MGLREDLFHLYVDQVCRFVTVLFRPHGLGQPRIFNPDGCEGHVFLSLIFDGFESFLRERSFDSVWLDLASDGFVSNEQVRDQLLVHQCFKHTIIDDLSVRSEKKGLQHHKHRQGDEEVPQGELLFVAHVFCPKLRAAQNDGAFNWLLK